MEFTRNDPIERQAELRTQIEQAEAFFRQASQPLPTLHCTWGLIQDDGRAVIMLTLRDTITQQERTVRYAREEMQSATVMFPRFHNSVGEVVNPG